MAKRAIEGESAVIIEPRLDAENFMVLAWEMCPRPYKVVVKDDPHALSLNPDFMAAWEGGFRYVRIGSVDVLPFAEAMLMPGGILCFGGWQHLLTSSRTALVTIARAEEFVLLGKVGGLGSDMWITDYQDVLRSLDDTSETGPDNDAALGDEVSANTGGPDPTRRPDDSHEGGGDAAVSDNGR
jgi:hypothetical protein